MQVEDPAGTLSLTGWRRTSFGTTRALAAAFRHLPSPLEAFPGRSVRFGLIVRLPGTIDLYLIGRVASLRFGECRLRPSLG